MMYGKKTGMKAEPKAGKMQKPMAKKPMAKKTMAAKKK